MMRGQMLLVVVLVMVVILTVSLSVASRTITNIRVSTDEEDSERAFSAAEAGLEQALSQDLTVPNYSDSRTLTNTSSYTTNLVKQTTRDFLLNNSLPVLKDDSVDVMLADYPSYNNRYTGNLTVYWGASGNTCTTSETSNTMAAVDIVVVSGTIAAPRVTHFPVDPCAARRARNNFANVAGGGNVSGKNFPFRTTINVNSGLIARVTPLYAATPIAVQACNGGGGGCAALPAQGTFIESTGKSENAQRKIITFRTFPKLPSELFPFVIFAPN